MRRRSIGGFLLAVLVVSSIASVGVAQEDSIFVRGSPELDVFLPDSTVTPGQTTALTVQVSNDGEVSGGVNEQRALVTTARDVRVEVESDDQPITVQTDRQSIGSIADGTVQEVPITITVPADVEPGEYSLDVELEYSYTSLFSSRGGAVQDQTRTVTRTIDVVIDDRPRFELRTVDSDVQVGGSGAVTVEVANVGGQPARALDVTLASASPSVTFGESQRATARLDRLGPGETRTIDYEVRVGDDAIGRSYSLNGTVQYTDPSGVRRVADGLSMGFSPIDEQAFGVDVETSTLRVGETGTIAGTIGNDGPVAVDDVVLVLEGPAIGISNATYAVGDLGVDESASFRFRASVPLQADAVPRQLDLTTRYRTASGSDGSTTDAVRVSVAERRDAVSVTAVEPEFAAGESGTLELQVRNQRDVEIHDVLVQLDVAEPLESDFRSAVVPSLGPDETGQVAFDLSLDGDARVNRYPATVGVNYTDPAGERAAVQPQTVAVSVVESSGDDLSVEIFIFGALLILVIAGAWWYYRG